LGICQPLFGKKMLFKNNNLVLDDEVLQ